MKNEDFDSGVDSQKLIQEITTLPQDALEQVSDYLEYLKMEYEVSLMQEPAKHADLPDLKEETFVGMWQDREEMKDSVAWVRRFRQQR